MKTDESMTDDQAGANTSLTTITDLIFPVDNPVQRAEINKYREEWEALNGPTDLTRYYTSMWPKEQRELLAKIDLKRYFDGLPPFAQDWIRGRIQMDARNGSLDNVPDNWLHLHMQGDLNEPEQSF